jgi:hypothetical protein
MRLIQIAGIRSILVAGLVLAGIAGATPLPAQQAAVPSAGRRSVLTAPSGAWSQLSQKAPVRGGSAWMLGTTHTPLYSPVRLEPTWAGVDDRSRDFALRGAAAGAAFGLVGYLVVEGYDCLGDRDPQSGEATDRNERLNCVLQTSIPLYLGGGAFAGGVLGWAVGRITR